MGKCGVKLFQLHGDLLGRTIVVCIGVGWRCAVQMAILLIAGFRRVATMLLIAVSLDRSRTSRWISRLDSYLRGPPRSVSELLVVSIVLVILLVAVSIGLVISSGCLDRTRNFVWLPRSDS